MKLSELDKSNYFRAMLLLSGKDRKISTSERQIINQLGEKLGFEKSFTSSAMNSLFYNENIKNDPPVFSNPEIAKSFIRDGIKLIIDDPQINQEEVDWISTVAKVNGVQDNWLSELLSQKDAQFTFSQEPVRLEIENYL
jgi:hypothetical protein